MKRIASFFLSCLIAILVSAQPKKPSVTVPGISAKEMMKMSQMSPEELEKYQQQLIRKFEKQAIAVADAGNINLDESLLQHTALRMPVRDARRIALIGPTPVSIAALQQQVQKIREGLRKICPAPLLQQQEAFLNNKEVAEIEAAAITQYYRNDARTALLFAMEAVQQKPDDLLQLNNLGALFNLCGMPHLAVPFLQYCLVKSPGSSMVQNNLGQSWLAMGEIQQATNCFSKCLDTDSLNPEANRSMGMLSLYRKEYAAAARYFAREAEVAHRRSSLASLAKAGNRHQLDLSAIRMKKMRRENKGNRDFFEEINLSKFSLPELPLDCYISDSLQQKSKRYQRAVDNEINFWVAAGIPSIEESRAAGQKPPGVYSDLVKELLADLDETYLPILSLFTDADHTHLINLTNEFVQKLDAIKCPKAPSGKDVTADILLAYERKCCDLKKPIIDQYLREYNELVKNRIGIVQPRWKEYINAMVNIAQLDASPFTRQFVYGKVYQYFVFLQEAAHAGKYWSPPTECHVPYTSQQADSILMQAKHEFDFNCPDWFSIEIPVKAATIKLDCESFSIEADLYELLHAGIEKKFKTGTTTLWVSAGVDQKFKDLAKLELTGKLYISWDQNNEFSDIGLKGTGTIDIEHVGSAEFGYGFGLNSGFDAQPEVKNTLRENLDKALGYLK